MKYKIYPFFLFILLMTLVVSAILYRNLYRKLCMTKTQLTYLLNPDTIPYENLKKLDLLSKKDLQLGQTEMKKHKTVFVGISRDNAKELPVMMKHIEYMGQHFKDYKVIVFENDSKDGTKNILKNWSKVNSKVKIITKDFHNKKRPSIKFLAQARNFYLQEIFTQDYLDFDLVIMMDFDMFYGFDIRGIQDSFSKIHQWDGVCSNGIKNSEGQMNDAFAFRNDEFPDGPANHPSYQKEIVPKIQKKYPVGGPLLKVHSCFGGMAIYKKKYLTGCFYDSIQEDCEHVLFHSCIKQKNNARLYMNPNQLVRYSHYKP